MSLQFIQRNHVNSSEINQRKLFLILAKKKAFGKQGNTLRQSSRNASLHHNLDTVLDTFCLSLRALLLSFCQAALCPGRLTVQTVSAGFFPPSFGWINPIDSPSRKWQEGRELWELVPPFHICLYPLIEDQNTCQMTLSTEFSSL